MWIWAACFICAFLGMKSLASELGVKDLLPGIGRERAGLKSVCFLLHEIEETLAAGLVPANMRWEALQTLPAPWGVLASESLLELRSCGGALLPTLKRLRALATEHDAALGEARARSSQALAQAGVCAILVPAFGSALYFLLPSLDSRAVLWCVACAIALALAGTGALWMLSMAESARWGGLPVESRAWVLAAQCAGERFLALVRSGNPADLAWTRACALLRQEAPGLAARWSASVWGSPSGGAIESQAHRKYRPPANGALKALEEAGDGLRKAVQVSLMEGRPCTERVETALQALRQDLRTQVERELSLLGTRALKPLFICVAPSLFALLAFGLYLSWEQMVGGGAHAGF
jgi:hypothetical protein